jgi:hypothetical protein
MSAPRIPRVPSVQYIPSAGSSRIPPEGSRAAWRQLDPDGPWLRWLPLLGRATWVAVACLTVLALTMLGAALDARSEAADAMHAAAEQARLQAAWSEGFREGREHMRDVADRNAVLASACLRSQGAEGVRR